LVFEIHLSRQNDQFKKIEIKSKFLLKIDLLLQVTSTLKASLQPIFFQKQQYGMR
jgi:hypothetical protein